MKHVYSNYMLIINKESTPSLCPSLTTMLLMAGTFSHLSFNIEWGGGGGGIFQPQKKILKKKACFLKMEGGGGGGWNFTHTKTDLQKVVLLLKVFATLLFLL